MNSDEDPDFYGGNEEEEDEDSQKEDKKKINSIKRKEIKGNADFTLNDGEEEDEIKNKKKNKNENKEEILKELKQENKKKDIKKDELNNSRDYGEDDDNNEPDFYALEEDGNDYYQSSDSENNNYNIKNKENIDEKRIREKLKKLNIDINNIYEINNKFNYSKDLPVFYIREEQKSFDNYPIPLSTNQLVEMIQKNNIPFESLRIKLVDLFEFKSKKQFIYIDLLEVLKPNWSIDVTYSKIYLELSKPKLKDNNINLYLIIQEKIQIPAIKISRKKKKIKRKTKKKIKKKWVIKEIKTRKKEKDGVKKLKLKQVSYMIIK